MRLADSLTFPAIMGILNVTPDSFSDGGRYLLPEAATDRAVEMVEEGAAVVDVGAESTRPGAEAVSSESEFLRVMPVLEQISGKVAVPISIDTYKSEVAEAAIDAGVSMVNDVTALRASPDMAGLCADRETALCLMHMQGLPADMQLDPHYEDVVSEVKSFLDQRMSFAVSEGVDESAITLDPGIGFGKTVQHNLELLARLDELVELGRPILVGSSRKSFIGAITGAETESRLAGTLASNVSAYRLGAAIFRVHDVAENRQALELAAAIQDAAVLEETPT